MGYEEIPADASLADPLAHEPFVLVGRWFDEARERAGLKNPLAMNVATVDPEGRPSSRMVLCRGFDLEAGFVVFYTNYESRKGKELAVSDRAAATFHWDALARQLRLEGRVVVSPPEESDAYFRSRPRASQIAAWASAQSEPLDSRSSLLTKLAEAEARFPNEVPRPPFWGGYRLLCEQVEAWVGSEGRAHDRVRWNRERAVADGTSGDQSGAWRRVRLQP